MSLDWSEFESVICVTCSNLALFLSTRYNISVFLLLFQHFTAIKISHVYYNRDGFLDLHDAFVTVVRFLQKSHNSVNVMFSKVCFNGFKTVDFLLYPFMFICLIKMGDKSILWPLLNNESQHCFSLKMNNVFLENIFNIWILKVQSWKGVWSRNINQSIICVKW